MIICDDDYAGTICMFCAKIMKEYRPIKNGDSLLGVLCDKCKSENIIVT